MKKLCTLCLGRTGRKRVANIRANPRYLYFKMCGVGDIEGIYFMS